MDIAVLSSRYPCGTIILAWLILKERILLSQGGGIAALIASILFTVWQLDKRCYF
uniref:EamA family transporter n=1 Tax=Methylobacter psychrophilus TaxID=96941 RepID=UPI00374E1104